MAVDGGQTGLRVALVENGRTVRTLDLAGFTYAVTDGVAQEAARLVAALRPVVGSVGRVALGLTSAPAGRSERVPFAEAVRSGLAADEVLVTSDMVTAHLGALGGADGVVVAAGTGAVTFGRSGQDQSRCDGLGYLLGDDGGGFAVGRAGLRAALRAAEGRGPATELVAAMARHYADVPDFPHGLYRRSDLVPTIAGFTREVATAAAAGDEVARSIWSDAVDELVGSVRSVVARCPSLAVADRVAVTYAGGLFNVREFVTEPFVERLPLAVPTAVVRPPLGDALDGARALLATDPAGYGDLISRSTVVAA